MIVAINIVGSHSFKHHERVACQGDTNLEDPITKLCNYFPDACTLTGKPWNSWFIQPLKASSACGLPRKLFTRSFAGIDPVLSSTVER